MSVHWTRVAFEREFINFSANNFQNFSTRIGAEVVLKYATGELRQIEKMNE